MFPKLNCVFIFKNCVSQPKFVFVVTWWFQKNPKQYLAKGQRHGSHPPFFRPAGPFPTVRAKCDVQVVEMRHRTSVGFHVVLVMPGWWFQIFLFSPLFGENFQFA